MTATRIRRRMCARRAAVYRALVFGMICSFRSMSRLIPILLGSAFALPMHAQVEAIAPADSISAIAIHPVFRQHFVCLEHPAGQLRYVGDALGADCLIVHLGAGPSGRWPAFYRGAGTRNDDWYGWNQPVLAPFDGVVDSVHMNPVVNRPGHLGGARASVIIFRRSDELRVLYAHVQGITVSPGDLVRAGQIVARVGNNGPAVLPHTHIAAWRGRQPFQLRFDLRAMGRVSHRLEAPTIDTVRIP